MRIFKLIWIYALLTGAVTACNGDVFVDEEEKAEDIKRKVTLNDRITIDTIFFTAPLQDFVVR